MGGFMPAINRSAAGCFKSLLVCIIGSFLLIGCGSTSKVRLEKGLSMEAFENLGPIDRKPATMAVLIPSDVRNAVVVQKHGEIEYTLDVGNTLSAKLIQILSYKFSRVVLLQDEMAEPAIPWDLKLRLDLADSDLKLETKAGLSTYTMKSGGYIDLKATVVNRRGQVVWFGSARAEGRGESAAGASQVPDVQGGLSEAIDIAVAQIAAQMAKSEALKKAIDEVSH
jgi:hypothetical protein